MILCYFKDLRKLCNFENFANSPVKVVQLNPAAKFANVFMNSDKKTQERRGHKFYVGEVKYYCLFCVLLNDWFKVHEGIAVDTHVKRISFRLGMTDKKDPNKIEVDLMKIIPQEKWGRITHLLISHGRLICKAQKPKCDECFLNSHCPRNGVEID